MGYSGLERNSVYFVSMVFAASSGNHMRENNRQKGMGLNEKEIHVLLKVGGALDRGTKAN